MPRRLLLVVVLSLWQLSTCFYIPAAPRCAVSRPISMMAKGRKQGGGPKIGLRKKKGKPEHQLAAEKRTAALMRRAANAKKKPAVGPGRQRERFAEQMGTDGKAFAVFARIAGTEEWLEAGRISIAKGSRMSAQQAASVQKRIILERAVRVHALKLAKHRADLECGVGPDAEPEGDADVNAVELVSGSGNQPGELRTLAAVCGFSGAPIPDAGHYWGSSDQQAADSDERNVKLQKFGDDAKSAVAQQESKMLGLRSG